jgi:hypothetical protein
LQTICVSTIGSGFTHFFVLDTLPFSDINVGRIISDGFRASLFPWRLVKIRFSVPNRASRVNDGLTCGVGELLVFAGLDLPGEGEESLPDEGAEIGVPL